MNTVTRVGLIGLGAMGKGMAQSLRRAGHAPHVFDVRSAMKPGSTFVMCSTVDPNWSVALEARLDALGLLYIDAPISGGAAKAASGR
jgi:putative dehydrogenase